MMKLKRWLMLLPMALLAPTFAFADSAHFEIITDGFDPTQQFNAIANPPNGIPGGLQGCLGNSCNEVIIDPLIRLNSGGGSPGVGLTFNFTGDGTFEFQNNSGQNFTSLEISLTMTKDEYDSIIASGADFTCDGGNIYGACGYQAIDPSGTETLNAFFYDPLSPNGIPSVPEPSQFAFLVIASAVIVVARIRKGSASSIFSRTAR